MLSLTRSRLLRTQAIPSQLSSARVGLTRLPPNQRHVSRPPTVGILRPPSNSLAFSTFVRRKRGGKPAAALHRPYLWKVLRKLIEGRGYSKHRIGWKPVIIVWLIALPIGAAVWLVYSSWNALKRKFAWIKSSMTTMKTKCGDKFRQLKRMEGVKDLISSTKSDCAKNLEGLKESISVKNWWKSEPAKGSGGVEGPTETWLTKIRSWYREPEQLGKVEEAQDPKESAEGRIQTIWSRNRKSESDEVEKVGQPTEGRIQEIWSRYRKSEPEKVTKVDKSLDSVEDGGSESIETAAEKKRKPLRDRFSRADTRSKR